MRELVYYVAVTLDGFIAQTDGSFNAFPWDDDFGAALLGTVRSAGASASLLAARAGAGGVATSAIVSTTDLTVVRHTWERDGCPVVALFAVHGGGHSIPGASGRFPRTVGRSDRVFPALAEALGFLDTPSARPGCRPLR